MSRPRGSVVVDTNVIGASIGRTTTVLSESYRPLLTGRRQYVSFQTAAELRFGAVRAGWGTARRGRLETALAGAKLVWASAELIWVYANLRVACERAGHALGQRVHEADRWIAATAVWLGVPLVTHDAVFLGTPSLTVETVLA